MNHSLLRSSNQATLLSRFRQVERTLVLGMTPLAVQLLQELEHHTAHRRRIVVGVLDDVAPPAGHPARHLYRGGLDRLAAVAEDLKPHRIVIALAERRNRTPLRSLLDLYVTRGVIVEDAWQFSERLTGKLALESLTPMFLMASGGFRRTRMHQLFARTISVLTAAVALVALSPLLLLIALAVKLDSRGPVLFAHQRVGAQGKRFTLLKFRTMRDGLARRSEWEGDNRDHVTRVGHVLRRFRLDELPQFINVLRGEMNIVGPRPHPVSNIELFTLVARNLNELTGSAISCYPLRLIVRPGLTGWAQVRYRYANNLDEEIEKLRYDLYYVKHMSARLDLRIILDTIKVLLRGHPHEDGVRRRVRATRPAVQPVASPAATGFHLPQKADRTEA
jgi:lipopolysaccharide/colanic/teichoic acid biosynthesis glycosyltransferase